MKLIALCGYPTAGKDELANYLCSQYCFRRIAFADPLRKALLALDPIVRLDNTPLVDPYIRLSVAVATLGWTEAKKHREVRELLQKMGTEAGRQVHGSNCWVDIAKREIQSSDQDVVITDLRFPNEVALVKSFSESFILQITRPNAVKLNNHASELLNYDEMCDGTFHNNGTVRDLWDLADKFIGAM